MEETLRDREAFEYYLGLGEDRNLVSVASHYGVSERQVARWSKEFQWQKRLHEREEKIGKKVEALTDKTIAEHKAKSLRVVSAVEDRFIERFNDGQVNPENVKDLETAIKLKLLLLGESTENVQVTGPDLFNELEAYANAFAGGTEDGGPGEDRAGEPVHPSQADGQTG